MIYTYCLRLRQEFKSVEQSLPPYGEPAARQLLTHLSRRGFPYGSPPVKRGVGAKDMKKIRNSGDWYLAGLIERCEPVGSGRTNPLRRGLTWLNHTLIQADSPEDAYRKAAAIGKESSRLRYKTTAGGTVQWRFVGIAELLRIHDDIGHGAEVLWTDIGRVSARKAGSMARRKGELIKQAT